MKFNMILKQLMPNNKILRSSPIFNCHHRHKWIFNGLSIQNQIKQRQCLSILIDKQNRQRFMTFRSFSSKPDKTKQDKHSEECDNEETMVPLLMNFVPRGKPNLFSFLKNQYLINFVIKNHIDRNFDFKDFIEGAKQALICVSSKLANNHLDELNGLVEEKALEEIRPNYEKLNMVQRKELQLSLSDIVLAFAHHVDIQTLKEDFTGSRKYIINFFVVFDCIRNLEETMKERIQSTTGISAREFFNEVIDRKVICNYEFKREYIEINENEPSQASDWVITKLLHIREKDLIRMEF